MVAGVDSAKRCFPGRFVVGLWLFVLRFVRVAILSNSAGSGDDEGFVDAARVEAMTGLPVIRHVLKKPACADEVLEFLRPLTAAEVCVVGDRLLTDVLFANQSGMLSILVPPIDRLRDHPVAILIRLLESLLLRLVRLLIGLKAKS